MQRDKKLNAINKSIYKPLLNARGDNEKALDFLYYLIAGKKSIFLTGKAGTGKSTLIRDIINCARLNNKNPIVLGSTGIAAVNIGGKTVHSYFKLPPCNIFYPDIIKDKKNFKLDEEKIREIESAPFIIIDEVSMLGANVVDCINAILSRNVGHKNGLAFGGKLIIFTGDVLQLAPVEKPERKKFFEGKYKNARFFNSHTFENRSGYNFDYNIIKLEKNYRQDGNDGYLEILDDIRNCNVTFSDIDTLNYNIKDLQEIDKKYIIIGTHNADVDSHNEDKFNQLPGKTYYFVAKSRGKAPETNAKNIIKIKVGAKIMMLNNDPNGRRINGSMGYVTDIFGASKEIVVKLDSGGSYVVGVNTWKNIIFKHKSGGELEKITIGEYTQLPVQLAYAITVHKSQGLTFEYAYLDIEKTFAGGQAYTALSRIKSLEGLALSKIINESILYFNQDALNYYQYVINEKKYEDDTLTNEDAKEYGEHQGFTINLNTVKSITEEQAEMISKFGGETIKLSGLTQLDTNTFVKLCNFKGKIIDLSGLENITYLMIEFLKNEGIDVISDLEYNTLGTKDNELKIVLKKDLIWNEDGTHIITGTKKDQDGYFPDFWNDNGKYKLTNNKYDSDGFDWNGRDRYDFGRDGIHKKTGKLWNERGFYQNFMHKNGTKYDDKGYDFFGHDKYGFDVTGIHRDTHTKRDKHWFNADGINKFTNTEVDNKGYSQHWYYLRELKDNELEDTYRINSIENEIIDTIENEDIEIIDIIKDETTTKKDFEIENEKELTTDGSLDGRIYNEACTIIEVEDKYEDGTLQYKGGKKIIKNLMGDTIKETKEGKGELYYRNGNLQYEGKFKNDLYDGEGNLYRQNGNIQFEGDFSEGKYTKGTEYFRFKNGKVKYEGKFENGLYHGMGKLYFSDGSIYEGNFKKGKFNGTGKFTFFDGEVYEGEFKNGSYDENLKRLI